MINIKELDKLKHFYIQRFYPHDDYKTVDKNISDFIEWVDLNDGISITQIINKCKSLVFDIEHGNTEESVEAMKELKPILEIFKNKI